MSLFSIFSAVLETKQHAKWLLSSVHCRYLIKTSSVCGCYSYISLKCTYSNRSIDKMNSFFLKKQLCKLASKRWGYHASHKVLKIPAIFLQFQGTRVMENHFLSVKVLE